MISEFIRYPHLERLGTDAVEDIQLGECYVFPKLDGTNAGVWFDGARLRFCSRNRELTPDSSDNQGFREWCAQQEGIGALCREYPGVRFYGEWLVPHTFKGYREDAWRKLYLFDAFDPESGEFWHYNAQKEAFDRHGVAHVPPMLIARNPSADQLMDVAKRNKYLCNDAAQFGEGIVIKRYGYVNKFGERTWAKLVVQEFKDRHLEEMGAPSLVGKLVEQEIAERITGAMVDKIIAKIRHEKGQFAAQDIARLLNEAYHDLITEELWDALKAFKSAPTVNFGTLRASAYERVKQLQPLLFGRSAQHDQRT